MTTTAVSPSTWKAPSHGHSSSRSSRPSTTPRTSYPTAASVGQSRPPILSPQARSVAANQGPSSASPSYFGFVVGDDSMPPDSGPGHHTKQNWNTTATTSRPSAKYMPNERNPEFELFRRQSEKSLPFALSGLPTPRSSSNNSPVNIAPADSARAEQQKLSSISLQDDRKPRRNSKPSTSRKNTGDVSFFSNIEQTQSPGSLTPEQSISDSRDARLSLPASELEAQLSQMGNPKVQRSETVSSNLCKENPCMAAPQEVVQAIQSFPQDVLVLDLRVYPQYAASRVRGALNLCIPTTLLKRPAFNVQKLAETFTGEADKKKFMIWSKAKYIIVYDATSSQAKEAVTSFNVLKKFSAEGWKGQGLVVKGGFHAIKRLVPRMIDSSQSAGGGNNMSTSPLAISPPNQNNLPVAGGCAMPATKNAANPFFGNIRQNMDLLDGVGQLPIHKPEKMSKSEEQHLPRWLKRAASISNDGKEVSDKFLGIERTEQKRMQKALSGNVSYGTPITESKSKADVQVAGIEKGSKNRYNNIFPFEHSRVRLQNVPSYGCDYVNASFVKAEFSNRKYIATQAPIPQTFEDFWKVVWEQDVKVVVMLTAESEGGQIKSHPYWQSSEYGPIRVKLLREEQVSLTTGHVNSAASQPKASHNRSQTTANATPFFEKMPKDAAKPAQDAAPSVTVRHLSILHTAYPFQTMRDVIQIQYTEWPDFGAPASPTSILSLIEMVNKYQLAATSVTEEKKAREPVPEGERPIVVHCSAGCGRTGTFCTIDSVIDMIKRQRLEALDEDDDDTMDVDSENDWVNHDEIDLVAKAVEDFRSQRLSMVQNLRQFVLCYESILQWLHDDTTGSRDGMRRSYHG